MRFRNVLSALLLLLGAFVLTSCNQTTFSQQTSNANKSAISVDSQIAQATPEEAKRISLEDAKAAYDKGGVVVVDTRDADSFAQEHIKGAINIPISEFEKRYQELPTNKQIIAYCSWPSEHTSTRAVLILKQHKIENAAALLGGTQGWKNKGYPMEK